MLDEQSVLILRTKVCKLIHKDEINFNIHKPPCLGHHFSFYFSSFSSFFFVPIKILFA